MPFPMNQKEYDNWTKTRTQGKFKYALKTSFITTIIVFLLYFIVNAYINLANIDKYIAYNIKDYKTLSVTLLITFVGLLICSIIIYSISEKRYKFTEENKNK